MNSGYCDWREDMDGNWETGCGQMQVFFEGGPKENDHRFCPYCGLRIWEYLYQEENISD